MKLSRWYLAISTASCVMLFTIVAFIMLESQNYIMATLFLSFAFLTPLLDEAMRDKLLKPESGTGRDAAIGQETDTENGSEEVCR